MSVNTTNFTPPIFNISPAGYTRRAFIKLKNLGNIGCDNWKCMWFYTCFRFIFWRNISWRMLKIAFPRPWISNFSGGACPQTPLEARAFGARFCEHHLKNSIFLASPPPPQLQIPLRFPWGKVITSGSWSFQVCWMTQEAPEMNSM